MTGLLPREAPIMIAADPIPTDMRTDIQRAAQGFASRVPLTDLIHKKTDTKKRKNRQLIRLTRSTARIPPSNLSGETLAGDLGNSPRS